MMKFLIILALAFILLNSSSYAQITSLPCTSSMLTSFTPCINYLTSSSGTGGSPTSDCCNSLRMLTSNGTGCLCQIVTGGVPIRIPFNRTLAIALPKACKQPGVPVQCKASPAAPLPAPGPSAAFGPSASPAAAVDLGPSGSTIPATEAPVSDTTPTSAGSVPTTPSTGTGSAFTPSSAIPSLSVSPLLLFCSAALMMVKYF
ncbi:hypothetical protein KSS87_020818 [Heliosperma pusillum]|nr:hypothetical protein KSS87_020818 [Heliosperma pusillum]